MMTEPAQNRKHQPAGAQSCVPAAPALWFGNCERSSMQLERRPENPIVTPGLYDWRRVAAFNPGVILHDGVFHMFERSCSSLDPLKCQVGLLRSDDGVSFELVGDKPVLAPEDFDTPHGTVEDPRVVHIDGKFYMTFVHRNYVARCFPNGVGVPRYAESEHAPKGEINNYRSGVAVSDDMKKWEVLGLITPPDIHDRDNVLFPEKIGGRYAMLRRPENYVGPGYGCDRPSMWLSYSDDLLEWSEPVLLARPEAGWESKKIGAASPPMKVDEGWLTLYHGVDENSTYRIGVMLLDAEQPEKVIGRSRGFIMEPEAYYEKVGLIIPNVIFPAGNIVKDGLVYVYYGCCDTCISVATVPLAKLLGMVAA